LFVACMVVSLALTAVLLQSTPDERDALYEAVYLPAIDNLVPIE